MEQEISLREIIETIWKGKWIIILTTLVLVLITGIVSFFVIEPTYEGRTTLMVSSNGSIDPKALPLVQYQEQVKNHVVMRETIQELKLYDNDITINKLRDKITTEIIKDTSLIRIIVKDSSPELASLIANTVTRQFINFMTDQMQEHERTTAQYTLDGLDSEIDVQRAALEKIETELALTPQFVVVNKSLSQDAFLNSVVQENTRNTNAQSGTLQYQDEIINPVYLSLDQRGTDIVIEIEKLERKKVEILDKIENYSFVAKDNLLVVSPAIPPERTVAPKKALNVAIAGVLGVMLSTFIVFFMHYWRETSQPTTRKLDNENTISV